jgi:hypothetical protein
MQEGTLVKIILTSGIEVVGTTTKQTNSTMSGSINVLCQRPLIEKRYKNKECFPTGETLSNGTERVKYVSHSYDLFEKRAKTVSTIYPETIRDIVVL